MKKLLMVCSLMLLVMATIAQVKPIPRKAAPVKKETSTRKKAAQKKAAQKKATQAPVILNNRNIQKVDPKVVQKNQPIIRNINIQNQKGVNKAHEEIRNTLPKAPVMIAPITSVKKEEKKEVKTTNMGTNRDNSNFTNLTPFPIQQMKNFKALNVGWLRAKEGEKQLIVADNRFLEQNKSTVERISEKKDGNMMCASERLKVEVQTKDFLAFTYKGVPDWLKPGIMLTASSFLSGEPYIEESVPRRPIILSTPLIGAKTTYLEVKDPAERHFITEAESKLKSQNALPPAAQMNFTFQEIRSAKELDLKLTGTLNSMFGNISSELKMESGTRKESYYYMVEFHQTMFSIEVNGLKENQIFVGAGKNTDDLIYISKVNYGRRGFIMFKSQKSLEQLGAEFKLSGGNFITEASLATSFNLLKSKSEVEIHAFFYGGSTESAAQSIKESIEKGTPSNIVAYIEAEPFNHKLAMPVGYELKNLQNHRVGMGSNHEKPIETCVPWKSDVLKLKVTLTDIQCINTSDKDKIADYGIRQHVYYRANGKVKFPAEKNLITHAGNCALGNDVFWPGATSLMCGGMSKQLAVNEGNSRIPNINNSVVFRITPDEYNDTNAEFTLETWVKEYNGGGKDFVLNNDPPRSNVAIKDVLDVLSGAKKLNENSKFKSDDGIAKGIEFDYFDGINLPLTQVKPNSKIILEGVIRARNRGRTSTDKAAVWVRFELID